jgi:hypothetical protein
VRERDRRTYTVIWVAITVVLALILVVRGSHWSALALVVVATVGLVAWLRVTHPRGDAKPSLGVFFDDLDGSDATEVTAVDPADPADPMAPTPPTAVAPTAGPGPVRAPAEVTGFVAAAPAQAPAPTPTAAEVAARADAPGAEVIDLRQPARREPAVPTIDDAVAASDEAAQTVAVTPPSPEVAEELSEHHVRLLRQVQVKLRDYQ